MLGNIWLRHCINGEPGLTLYGVTIVAPDVIAESSICLRGRNSVPHQAKCFGIDYIPPTSKIDKICSSASTHSSFPNLHPSAPCHITKHNTNNRDTRWQCLSFIKLSLLMPIEACNLTMQGASSKIHHYATLNYLPELSKIEVPNSRSSMSAASQLPHSTSYNVRLASGLKLDQFCTPQRWLVNVLCGTQMPFTQKVCHTLSDVSFHQSFFKHNQHFKIHWLLRKLTPRVRPWSK